MKFEKLHIMGIAHIIPDRIVTSLEISQVLLPYIGRFLGSTRRLAENFIELYTGIKERRLWADANFTPSKASVVAAQKVLHNQQIKPSEIDLLINTSVTRDFIEPAISALIHGELGLRDDCRSFDISNACVGFMDAIEMAGVLIEHGHVRYALITAGEDCRHFLNGAISELKKPTISEAEFRLLFANLTLGSGAVAVILCRDVDAQNGIKIHSSTSLTDTSNERNKLCTGQINGISTNSSELLKVGVNLAMKTLSKAEIDHAFRREIFNHVICHQVSDSNNNTMLNAWKIPLERAYKTYPLYGNIGAASVLLTLSMALEEKVILNGHQVLLAGIGSGVNCTFMHLTA